MSLLARGTWVTGKANEESHATANWHVSCCVELIMVLFYRIYVALCACLCAPVTHLPCVPTTGDAAPPSDISPWIPSDAYDIYVVGVQVRFYPLVIASQCSLDRITMITMRTRSAFRAGVRVLAGLKGCVCEERL